MIATLGTFGHRGGHGGGGGGRFGPIGGGWMTPSGYFPHYITLQQAAPPVPVRRGPGPAMILGGLALGVALLVAGVVIGRR